MVHETTAPSGDSPQKRAGVAHLRQQAGRVSGKPMATYDPTPKEASDPRDRYIPLGTDSGGAHHTYRTTDETVHVVQDAARIHVEDVADRPVEEWIQFVANRRGWDRRTFGLGIADMVSRAVDCGAGP